MITARGFVTAVWAGFFRSVQKPALLAGLHAERLADFAPENQPAGTSFIEADRGALYFVPDVAAIRSIVDQDSAAATSVLYVASTAGFGAGQTILVAQGTARQEKAAIAGVTAGVSLTLATPLAFTHTQVQADRVALSPQWVLLSAESEAALADIPADLGALDRGFRFRATDYNRRWRWTGTAWERADQAADPHRYIWTDEDPGTGWVVADGSTITRTKADATTENFTVQNLIGYYIKGGAAVSSSAAVAPGISGSTGGPTGTSNYNLAAGAVAVPSTLHTHDAGTLAVDATGEPATVVLLPYYRV